MLLSIVGLYAATKDRWNWTRILKWGVGLPLVGVALLAIGLWGYSIYEDRPTSQDSFEGLKLSSTPADVRFLKGEPIAKHSTDDRFVYDTHSGSAEAEDAVLIVQFREGRVRHIAYWAHERQIVNPYLLGFSIGSHYDEVIKQLGEPSHTSTSSDGLSRLLSFEKYQVFFEFERGKVRTYGIFDKSKGPMKFSKEAAQPASAPKQ